MESLCDSAVFISRFSLLIASLIRKDGKSGVDYFGFKKPRKDDFSDFVELPLTLSL